MIRSVDLLYSIAGFCVSLPVGMTGVGGGSLMTPLLVLLYGIHPATAVGTDLRGTDERAPGPLLTASTATSIGTSSAGSPPAALPMTALILLVSSSFGARRRLNPST
jgi:uncharacterized membrane protein YfcA